jgi:ParB family chromosome partitioning protein
MSKRADAIRSLFAASAPGALSADNTPAKPRVSAGSVRSLQTTFSDVETENDQLRAEIAAGVLVVEIDPELVDPSPIVDRLDDVTDDAYAALRLSISERGQEVPALLRPHPSLPGRYQTAYGHRRVRVAKELARPLRAVVRGMSDDELVVAQGVENSAREDLSFIERALFAKRLEEAGFDRGIVQQALAIDRAETSKLIAVAKAVPSDILQSIGRAPKVGRGRWQAFSGTLATPAALKRVRKALRAEDVGQLPSDGRFVRAFRAASSEDVQAPPSMPSKVFADDGVEVARLQATGRDLRLVINRASQPGFAEYLVDKLPGLFADYVQATRTSHPET